MKVHRTVLTTACFIFVNLFGIQIASSCLIPEVHHDHKHGNDTSHPTIEEVAAIFAQKLINQFSHQKTMSIDSFHNMLNNLEKKHIRIFNHSCKKSSVNILSAIEESQDLNKSYKIDFAHMISICPTLLYHIANSESFFNHSECNEALGDLFVHDESRNKVWLYSTLSIIGISLCGLSGVAVIPIVDKHYYSHVLQYFVALAVGTLVGDALLHLLPHSMRPPHDNMNPEEIVDIMMYRGIAAVLGIIFFCFIERFLSMLISFKNNAKKVPDEDSTNLNNHKGHSHQHGHSQLQSKSLSSIVWMVILGDGLHNFTDGMTIGAAFSTNIAGGFSTTVAVFCHELPHEMGDFAVLLKAGMSARQAIFYNILSSILSFIGMCVGINIGNTPESSQWVFAVAAGLFIYIALVDMVPELTARESGESFKASQFILQFTGMCSGFAAMLLIAIYEHDLERIFT